MFAVFKDLETDLRLYSNLSHIVHRRRVGSVDIREDNIRCGATAADGFTEMRQNEPCRVAGICFPVILLL